MNSTLYHIAETVVEDTRAYRGQVEKFLAGETSAIAFKAIRVPMGIYEQRENDRYMVRVRGAAGVFLPEQIRRVAELSREFGNGTVHVTTRQDLQIHRADIADTPTILDRLLEVELSSRGGGGNTVRNISACPRAGVCESEAFDVTPHAFALTEYLIRERGNFNLPRKFKAAFSGCATDCALASVADLGFFAHIRDGERGFAVYAAGGMGSHSALSVLIEEFIPAESIFEVAEAVKRLFDKHGDRANRHKARLRYVVKRVGVDVFRSLYGEELAQVRRETIQFPVIHNAQPQASASDDLNAEEPDDAVYRKWKAKRAISQKQQGLCSVAIPLPLGDIDASALSAIADLAHLGNGAVRTSQDQDLLLTYVPESALYELYSSLKKIDDRFVSSSGVKTVACAGASTCKLGLCLSRGLADALEHSLSDIEVPFDDPIYISGCPNSCGHHPIASIGLYGTAQRVNDRLVPFYGVVAGGRPAEENAGLAKFVARVPARALPKLLSEFFAAADVERNGGESLVDLLGRWGTNYLTELATKYESVPSYEESSEFYRDFGGCQDFSLAGRGPGECGAGVMDVIALDIDAAKSALREGRLYDALVASAGALLVTRGLEPKKDREVFAAFSEHLIDQGWISDSAGTLLDSALDFKLGDRDSLDDLRDDIATLLSRVERLFGSLDANLNFRIERVEVTEQETGTHAGSEETTEIDLRGVACPMNFVRAKVQLEQIDIGEVLDILLDEGEPARNVPASFADQGEEVVSVTNEQAHFRVRVRKRT